jgi:hypothetical protein
VNDSGATKPTVIANIEPPTPAYAALMAKARVL